MNETSQQSATTPQSLWSANGIHEEVFLIDVRTPAEFREAHIPGSFNAPLGDLSSLGPDVRERASGRRVAVVCRTGKRAEVALDALREAGVDSLEVVEGGLAAWQDVGLPLNRGDAAISLERQVRIAAGSLVLVGVVLGWLVHAAFFCLAAFVGAGLVFSGVTDTCGMALVLAKMPWNRAPTGRDG